MNTKYRAKAEAKADNSKRYGKKTPFDATNIIEKYKNINFGTIAVNEIRLCEMSGGSDCTGYYNSISEFKF